MEMLMTQLNSEKEEKGGEKEEDEEEDKRNIVELKEAWKIAWLSWTIMSI